MAVRVGRKPKSKNLGLMQLVEIPLQRIDWKPDFVRGAKREIRDKNGKLLYSARNMRVGSAFCMKKDVEKTLEIMIENGFKNPKAYPMTQMLPRICPSCDNEGTLVWSYDHRDKRKLADGTEELKTEFPKIQFYYNHSKTYPRNCRLGTWDYISKQIRLKEGIDFRKMFVGNYLKEGEERHFDLEDLR